jgi:hypothetical protein
MLRNKSFYRRISKHRRSISIAAAAVASGIFAQHTRAVTLNQYYFDVSVYSDSGLTNLISSVVINQSNPVVNIPSGDYLSFGISDVLTNNANPAAGDTSGKSGHNPAQPANLGIASLGYYFLSSDATAATLAPNLAAGIRTTLETGQVDYYATDQLRQTTIMPIIDPGDIVPNSTIAGDIGLNFQIFASANLNVSATTASGVATISAFAPTSGSSASFANSTPLFDYLSYQGVVDGTVTLTPMPMGFSYWTNTLVGTGTTPSEYSQMASGTADTIVPIPNLTVNVFDAPPPTHAIISLTANAPGSFGYGPLYVGDPGPQGTLQRGIGDPTDFIQITGLNPTPQTEEIIALEMNVTGLQLDALVEDIDSSNIYGYGAAIASTSLANDPFPSYFNLFMTFSDAQVPPILNGTDYLSFDFTQDPNVEGAVVDSVGATVVPEPMSLGGVILGSVCLLSLRSRRREWRGRQSKVGAP